MQFVQLQQDPGGAARPLVLVVDDEPSVRRVVARYLYRCGLNVVQAAGGTEGLEQLTTGAYAAVVTDVHMPRGDGFTLWEEATRQRPELRGRFVFCSSFATGQPGSVRAAGERFLQKPFDLAELAEAVGEILAGGGEGVR